MARTCHSEGLRERQQMQNSSAEEKYDLGYWGDDGCWNHICRYSNKADAQAAKERLSDPSEKEQNLIGVPAEPTLELISR